MKMMKTNFYLLTGSFILSTIACFSEEGSTLFNDRCISCHTVGNGTLVGPDLKDVFKKYPEERLVQWIRSSAAVIKRGDTSAINLFARFNKIVMPDQDLEDPEIKAIIAFIRSESDGANGLLQTP